MCDISSRKMQAGQSELVVVASRSHGGERLENYLDELAQTFSALERQPVGSSLKLCTLAVGDADCYPRLGPTSEWDIAAAHAVLRAAGGEVYTFDTQVLAYNTKESLLNPEFVAVADAGFDWFAVLPEQPPL
jgi:3'(2'), 5'-bisphosphate nucleotidase